jgi:hypothetical protein
MSLLRFTHESLFPYQSIDITIKHILEYPTIVKNNLHDFIGRTVF